MLTLHLADAFRQKGKPSAAPLAGTPALSAPRLILIELGLAFRELEHVDVQGVVSSALAPGGQGARFAGGSHPRPRKVVGR